MLVHWNQVLPLLGVEAIYGGEIIQRQNRNSPSSSRLSTLPPDSLDRETLRRQTRLFSRNSTAKKNIVSKQL